MARAIPQVVRKYEQVSYEREVLGNEPVTEKREPKLIDTKIDVNFYLSEVEAQCLYTALEMGIQAMVQEVRNYGTHQSVIIPGREPVHTSDDWNEAFKTSKNLADILFDALITAVEHRTADEEPEPEKVLEVLELSELERRLLEYYSAGICGTPGRDILEFIVSEAKNGRIFSTDGAEEAETQLESLGFLQWVVRSDTPEGLVPRLTDAGRDYLACNPVSFGPKSPKPQWTRAGKFTDFTHELNCPRRKQTGMSCICPENKPKYVSTPGSLDKPYWHFASCDGLDDHDTLSEASRACNCEAIKNTDNGCAILPALLDSKVPGGVDSATVEQAREVAAVKFVSETFSNGNKS